MVKYLKLMIENSVKRLKNLQQAINHLSEKNQLNLKNQLINLLSRLRRKVRSST